MCTGLSKGLAGAQFSGSPNLHGETKDTPYNSQRRQTLRISFKEKKGLNLTLLQLEWIITELLLLTSWSINKWAKTTIAITKGKTK
jgi:hypothetical protein